MTVPQVETIGPYRILGRLGGGGMGVIYRAAHAETGRLAAVKTVLFPRRANLSSIRTEVHALGRLRNPGVVRILEQGMWDGLPWYAMELLDGTTLRDWMNRLWPDRVAPPREPSRVTHTDTNAAAETVSLPGDRLIDPGPESDREPDLIDAPRRPAGPERPHRTVANGRLAETLRVFGKLCGPLAFIHGEGIVHRDLKPANVFIRDDGSPVLVDFGLASVFRGAVGRATLEVSGDLMGTVAYMAPERVRAELVDARSDLYALGCMLYEALTGQVPFSAPTSRETARKHLYQWPPPPSELAQGVPPALERLVLTLLDKTPSDRIGHADDVAEILFDLAARETGQRSAPVQARAPAHAAGYLYRPELVGRDAAMTVLDAAARDAATGAGALVLILGESGVGKTFLATEAARRAQLQGLRVVAGDAMAIPPTNLGLGAGAGAGAAAITGPPFHVFRQLLQTVADICRESAGDAAFDRLLGDRARILAPYEPALAVLPGHDRHPRLAEIPGEATRRRAIAALMDLLAACARDQPLCLVIDDLQWADDLSMALLAALPIGWLAAKGILLVATCRSDEMGDEICALAARSDVRSLRLPMLNESAVTSLVAGMLGMKEAPPALVSFLTRQTEGNPFFVTEYLRAAVGEHLLYRERGQWRVDLPEGADTPAFETLALPGSLQELVQRRLLRLSTGARELVRTAAVLGRQLDSTLLETIAHLDESAFLEARGELCAREILEEIGGARLRFIHDKMREITYQGISADQRRRRHLEAGGALEQRFRGTPDIDLLYGELAHHFTCAGDGDKAIGYLEKAGQQALANSANREAIQRFRAALDVDAGAAVSVGQVRRATWERQIGDAEFALTALHDSREHLMRALDHLGLPFPATRARLFFGVLAQVGRQVAHRLWPARFVPASAVATAPRAEALAEGARAYESLLQIFYMASRPGPILYGAMRLLNLCEMAGPSPALARAYAGIFGTAGVMGLHALARSYLTRATQMLSAAPDPTSESWVYQLATFYWMGVGAWSQAEEAGQRAAASALAVGNRRRWEESQLGMGLTQLLGGKLRAAQATFEGMRDSGMKGNHNAEQHAWILLSQVHTRLGNLGQAREGSKRAAAMVPSKLDATVLGELHATQALTALARGDHATAREAADRAATALWSLPPVMNMLIPHLASLCEVYLSLWAHANAADGGLAEASLRQAARDACVALRKFARVFPIVAPIVGVHEARLAWLTGQRKSAVKRWRAARATASRLRMPYEEAQATLALARHGSKDDAERHRLASRARALLDELGVARPQDGGGDDAVTSPPAASPLRSEVTE